MAATLICVLLKDLSSSWDHSSVLVLKRNNVEEMVPSFISPGTSASALTLRHFLQHRVIPWRERLMCPNAVNSGREIVLGRSALRFPRYRGVSTACHPSELTVARPWDIAVHKDGSKEGEKLLWICGEEQISQECCLRRGNDADTSPEGRVSEDSSGDMTSGDLGESLVRRDHSPTEEPFDLVGEKTNLKVHTTDYSIRSFGSEVSGVEIHNPPTEFESLNGIESMTPGFANSQKSEQDLPVLLVGDSTPNSFGGPSDAKYEKEMEVAVRAVQLACVLSQNIQQRVLRNEENTDFKKDRSLVTVADWGVQAVVSWILAQVLHGQGIPMIAEEDTTGLRGAEKIDLLQRVVAAVNDCLQHAEIVGVCPPARPLGAIDVLKAINKGSAEGGPKGRYWVLDPVDGTLGFVRGDQYAIALALIEDGAVVLAVLGCPNYPLRKQWLVHHHRYYRIASRLHPPSPSQWHKGLILTAAKGAGQVIMRPLVMKPDGSPQWDETLLMATSVSVSPIDDPSKATFCEPFEKANSSHSFTAGLAEHLGLRNRPLRVYSMAKYAAIARGDAEIFMKFAKAGYQEKIWDHAAGVLIVQEAGGVVTDAGGKPLDFSRGRFLENLDRGIIACSGKTLHDKLLKAVDASWNSSRL